MTPREESAKRKAAFLGAYAHDVPTISAACRVAGITRSTFERWRDTDEKFAADFAETKENVIDSLEQEAFRRAREGWDEPIFFQGQQVGSVRRFDTTLIIFLLKANRPEKYRDNYNFNFHLQNESPLIQIDQRVMNILANSEVANALIEAAAQAGTDRTGDGAGEPGQLGVGDYAGDVEVGSTPGAAEQEAPGGGVHTE